MKKEFLHIFLLLLLCLTLFFFRLGARPLWDTDEGMHASTSKDMVLRGDWITPTFNGENFYDKPILHNWLVSVSFLVFGFTEFAARLPSAILGLGGVLVTYLLGRRMFGPAAGLLSGAILATSVEYAMLSRTVVHDISLCFFMTLAFFFFYEGFADEKHRKRSFILFYASLGFAVLAKGPVGVLLPVLIIGLFLILERKLSFLKEMEIGWGVLIFLVVAAPWYLLISLRNSDYGWYFFIHNNLMRFLNPRAQHHHPFYYYFLALAGGFFPWSCFLPLSVVQAFRERFKKKNGGTLFLLLWFFVIFIFFSAASSKLSTYILPLFPAASLLVGSFWHDLAKTIGPVPRKAFLCSFVPLLIMLPLVLFYFWISPPTYYASKYGINFLGYSYLVLWVGGGAILSFCLALRKWLNASFGTLGMTIVSVFLFVEWAILPTLDPYLSTKALGQRLDQMVPPEEKLVFINSVKEAALFYTNRRALILRTPKETIDYLRSDRRVFCIINRSLYNHLDKVRNMSYIIEEDGGKLIISNQR